MPKLTGGGFCFAHTGTLERVKQRYAFSHSAKRETSQFQRFQRIGPPLAKWTFDFGGPLVLVDRAFFLIRCRIVY